MSIREEIAEIISNWTTDLTKEGRLACTDKIFSAIRSSLPKKLGIPLGANKLEKYQEGFNSALSAIEEKLKT